MAKLDFVQVTGYSVVYHGGDDYQFTTPIIGLYVERHGFAVEVLTYYGEVIELFPQRVLKLPDGKYAYADLIFGDEDEWLDWASPLECDDVCAECMEKEEAEQFAKWQAEQTAKGVA